MDFIDHRLFAGRLRFQWSLQGQVGNWRFALGRIIKSRGSCVGGWMSCSHYKSWVTWSLVITMTMFLVGGPFPLDLINQHI